MPREERGKKGDEWGGRNSKDWRKWDKEYKEVSEPASCWV
jgi:hypothetical protein